MKKKITKKDKECNTYEEFGEAVPFQCEVWSASGKVQAEQYGERLSYIKNIKVNGIYEILSDEKNQVHYLFENGLDMVESDGICIYVGEEKEPDYKILSIKPNRFLRLEVEKI